MMKKGFKTSLAFFIVAILMMWNGSHAVVAENTEGATLNSDLNSTDPVLIKEPIFYPVLQESLVDNFERASLAPWTTTGYNWGIRDTADTYGPN